MKFGQKYGLGDILGDFPANSSGHPADWPAIGMGIGRGAWHYFTTRTIRKMENILSEFF
jgi:hypothetical protein